MDDSLDRIRVVDSYDAKRKMHSLAVSIANNTTREINKRTTKGRIHYKYLSQAILEEVIEILKRRV